MNISSSQATAAASALQTASMVDTPPSPSTSMQASTHSAPVSRAPSQLSTRTEELILHELQKLSARMSQVEQDLQTDTFTSTPRRRKKARTRGKRGGNSTMGGTNNVTENHTTLEESIISSQHDRVVVPVHTQHITKTTSVSTTSLFSQRNPLLSQQTRATIANAPTQVVFSTCQSMHPGQHVANRLPTTQIQIAGSGHHAQNMGGMQVGRDLMNGTPHQGHIPVQGMGVQGQENTLGSVGSFNPPEQAIPVNTYTQNTHTAVRDTNQANLHVLPGVAPTVGLSHMQGGANHQQMEHRTLPSNAHIEQQGIIPSLQALRTTAVNQDLVQHRLEELQQQATPQAAGNQLNCNPRHESSNNSTSHRKGKKEKIEVVWPQDCAFVGHLRSRVTYEQLTQSQFVLGYLRSVQEEENPYIRANMVDYLTELFQNTCDFGWQAAKGAHLVVMTKMEEGLVNWSDLKKVNKVRKTYVRAAGNSPNSGNMDNNSHNNKKNIRKPSSMPCKDFQEGKCSKHQDHEVGLITHKHICAYCLYTLNRMYGHPENMCNNKKHSKNGQYPHPQQ